jgi:hypothetical protein
MRTNSGTHVNVERDQGQQSGAQRSAGVDSGRQVSKLWTRHEIPSGQLPETLNLG